MAFEAMLKEIAAESGRDPADLSETALRDYIRCPEVAEILLDIALGEQGASVDTLRKRFDELFCRENLLVDFDHAMERFIQALSVALDKEAARPGSPLYNRVSLAHLKRLRRGLERQPSLPRSSPPPQLFHRQGESRGKSCRARRSRGHFQAQKPAGGWHGPACRAIPWHPALARRACQARLPMIYRQLGGQAGLLVSIAHLDRGTYGLAPLKG